MSVVQSKFTALCFIGVFARFSYALARTPVLPLFALYLGAAPESIGLIVGISTVTGIFFKLPAGALSDLIGRKRTMLAGLSVFASMPFAYLLVTDYHSLIAIRFLHGFATAIYGPVAMAVVMDISGGRKGEMISWFSSLTIIGNLLGAPVGGLILHGMNGDTASSHEFMLAYLVSGITGMVALALGIAVLRGDAPPSEARSLRESFDKLRKGVKEVFGDKGVFFTSNMEGLQNMSVGALEAFLPIYTVTVAGLNEFQAGILWGVQVLVTILSKPVMGRISDRRGRKPLVVWGMVFCAASFVAIPFTTSFVYLMALALIFGLGEAFVTSSSAALVADLCRERNFGTAMGAFGTIYDVGHASGPILAGVLISAFDYRTAFVIIASILLLSIPLFISNVKEPDLIH